MPKIAGAFIVMAIVIAAVLIARSQTGEDNPQRVAELVGKQLAKGPRGSLTPDAVLAIGPRATGQPAAQSRLSASMVEFLAAKSYASTYARLSSRNDLDAEEKWILARIIDRCARVTNDGKTKRAGAEERARLRERFVAALPTDDPDRDQRITAFDRVQMNPCAGLEGMSHSAKDARALYEASASAGDPKARVAMIREEMGDFYVARQGKPGFYSLSAGQMETLKQAISSGDPVALTDGAILLAVTRYDNVSVRSPDGRSLDTRAFVDAANLVACDEGYPCGPENYKMQSDCAFMDYCMAVNLRDHVMYYSASPYTSQMIAQYEGALRSAATSNDWSGFRFMSGPDPLTVIR